MAPFSELKAFQLGDLVLEDGSATLPNAFLGYKTIGTYSPGKEVLVMPTAYSGNVDGNAWLAGPLSDARQDVFLMSPAMFGSGDSASPSNTPAPFDGPRFPRVSLRDNIRAQRKLLEHLCPGITEIKVVGWSMGAAQCYHWAAMEPELVKAIVPLCGSAKTSPHNHTFLEGIKLSLLADVDFCDGDYVKHGKFPEAGIKAFGTTYCSYGTSQDFFRNETYKSLGIPDLASYVRLAWVGHFRSKDPNDLLLQLHSWQTSDISNAGSVKETLAKLKARCLIMPCDRDMYFPPEDSYNEEAAIGDKSRAVCVPIVSEWGHMSASGQSPKDTEFIAGKICEFFGWK